MANLAPRPAALLGLGLLATSLMTTPRTEAADQYWRCELARVAVISNSSPTRCELLLRATVRYEQLLSELIGMQLDESITPLRLYSLTRADAREYMFTEKELSDQVRTRQAIHSRSMPGLELNVLSIVDLGGDGPLQSALNLYSQMLMSSGPTRSYPAWYQLGVATLLNGLMIRPDGMVILSRNPAFLAVVDDSHKRASADARVDLPALLDAKPSGLQPADYNEFARRAQIWAQFGLLTTPERRKQYHDLADLMRQGTPAEEAVPVAFGISLKELTEQFERGAWRKDVSYRVPAPANAPSIATPLELDAAAVDEQLQALQQRVAQFGAR
jgi:hypothetical protein